MVNGNTGKTIIRWELLGKENNIMKQLEGGGGKQKQSLSNTKRTRLEKDRMSLGSLTRGLTSIHI